MLACSVWASPSPSSENPNGSAPKRKADEEEEEACAGEGRPTERGEEKRERESMPGEETEMAGEATEAAAGSSVSEGPWLGLCVSVCVSGCRSALLLLWFLMLPFCNLELNCRVGSPFI